MYLLPFVLLILKGALPQVIVPGLPIVPTKDIHRAIIQHSCMISPWARPLAFTKDARPFIVIQVKVKEIVEVVPLLALVAPKKVEAIHVGESPRS